MLSRSSRFGGLALARALESQAAAQSTVCKNNLKQLQIGWQLYADDNNGHIVGDTVGYISGYFLNTDGWVLGNPQYYQTDYNLRAGNPWSTQARQGSIAVPATGPPCGVVPICFVSAATPKK